MENIRRFTVCKVQEQFKQRKYVNNEFRIKDDAYTLKTVFHLDISRFDVVKNPLKILLKSLRTII